MKGAFYMDTLKNLENIETKPVTTEVLSPRKYISVHKKKAGSIKSAKFLRPQLGGRHFGKFRVTYKYPIYKSIERK